VRLIRLPFYCRGHQYIKWGTDLTVGVGARIDAFSKHDTCIYIGDNVQLNDYVHIAAIEKVTIGNDVLIASRVFISDHGHGSYSGSFEGSSPDINPRNRPEPSKPVCIGDRVWIGEQVCILPGVTIGSGSVIGAGSIVTKDIPADTIVAGNPAKSLKMYDRETRRWIKT